MRVDGGHVEGRALLAGDLGEAPLPEVVGIVEAAGEEDDEGVGPLAGEGCDAQGIAGGGGAAREWGKEDRRAEPQESQAPTAQRSLLRARSKARPCFQPRLSSAIAPVLRMIRSQWSASAAFWNVLSVQHVASAIDRRAFSGSSVSRTNRVIGPSGSIADQATGETFRRRNVPEKSE
jgi:hypothetical protein